VEAGQVMIFARAIGDPNPIYFDESYAASTELGHVIAPPTFTRSSLHFDRSYALRSRMAEAQLGSGSEATGLSSRSNESHESVLHAEQHFEYHADIRPGDVLTFTQRKGKSWQRHGRKGGMLHFQETLVDFHNESGDHVLTSTSISVRISIVPKSD